MHRSIHGSISRMVNGRCSTRAWSVSSRNESTPSADSVMEGST
jgi:hypothetical protein